MNEPRTNRFHLEEGSEEKGTIWVYEGEPEPEPNAHPVYLEESEHSAAEESRRGRGRFRNFLIAGLLLLLLAGLGTGVYLKFFHEKLFPGTTAGKSKLDPNNALIPREKLYFPTGRYSTELQAAIGLYKSNERDQAKRAFENFVRGTASLEEKAVALTYMGLMHLEAGRNAGARHYLVQALQKSPDYVPAIVNLAIAEKRLGNLKEAEHLARRAAKIAPSDPVVNILLGNIQALVNPDKAISSYKKGLRESPGNPQLLYNMALVLLGKQNYEEAALQFSRAAQAALTAGNRSLAARSYAHLGQIHFFKNRPEKALDFLARALKYSPGNGRYLYNMGVIHLRGKRHREAARLFNEALKSGSADPRVMMGLSRAFREIKQPSLAIRALEKILYSDPNYLPALFALADLYYEEKMLLKAASTLKKIVRITPGDRNTRDALLKLGAVEADLENHDAAVQTLKQALQLDSRDVRVWHALGLAYKQAGKKDLAVAAWKKALAAPGDGTGNIVPLERKDERMIRLELARVYREEGARDLALQQYRLILAANMKPPVMREDPEVRLEMGRTNMELKDYPAAVRVLKKVAQARSASPEQRRDSFLETALAYSRSERTPENLELAKSYIYKASRLAPGDDRVRLTQASILLATDSITDRERALEILRALTRSQLESELASHSYNLLGLAHYKNNDFSAALTAFDYAIQLNPSNQAARDNRRLAANALERGRPPR